MSAGLRLTGLDDFITPSQACIKPVESVEPAAGKGNSVSIQFEEDGTYQEVGNDGSKKQLAPAKITLNDCLACSGCITSAESVLITQQSVDEFLSVLAANQPVEQGGKVFVVSVSPQAWASVATKYNIPGMEALGRMSTLFRSLGAAKVMDVVLARDLSLVEACEEHLSRARNTEEKRPVLASACPGWVCYAEKTQHPALPYMSAVKSPQQIAGTLVKGHVAAQLGVSAAQVYHICLMPCFDKKLEASRDDFLEEVTGSREVDLVLTSAEVVELLEKRGLDFLSLPPSGLDNLWGEHVEAGLVAWGPHGSSGSYAETVFAHAALAMHGRRVVIKEAAAAKGGEGDTEMGEGGEEGEACVWKQVRNSDFHELVLPGPDGSALLKVARCYGFRNIQNVVRQLKSAKGCAYSYIEVMACPTGCVNGGGQIRVEEGGETPKARLARVFEAYRAAQQRRVGADNGDVSRFYTELLAAPVGSEKAKKLLHTVYHARTETLLNPIGIQW